MIENVPDYIGLAFIATTLLTLFLLFRAIIKSGIEPKKAYQILGALVVWLILQGALTLSGLYKNNLEALPPKLILFGISPAIIFLIFLFNNTSGKNFIDSLPLKPLTYLHVVRIPVELVLYGLYLSKAIPQLMTFEGSNFDILAGISAPIAAFLFFKGNSKNRKLLLIWNLVCLALLFNIVFLAAFSAPFPMQLFAFDQPNMAVVQFPYSWLPVFIVPVVLFSHLVAIRKLIRKEG